MQQYVYGNIGHQAYRIVSSDPYFFADAQRATVLRHLMSYDRYCQHGELTAEEHQCFWMVTTDLDQPGERERLYLQVSGGEFHRSGFYVHGYMSDEKDPDLYGPKLLQLLRTQFASGTEILDAAQKADPRALTWDQVPQDTTLRAARVDPRLLRGILLGLMEGKRVILRLPSVGAEAMRHSRELLLAIYERLPYEQRRVNGFITGASAAKVFDESNSLPAVVNLILMDADADIEGIANESRQVFYDCADPAFVPKEDPTPYEKLVDFLSGRPVSELEEYFQSCRDYIRDGMDGSSLKIADYQMLLDFFNVGRIEFTDEQIRMWAFNLLTGKWPPRLKQKLIERIAGTLKFELLTDYLTRRFDKIVDLAALGIPDKQEMSGGNARIQDINGALTLRMAELLLPFYPKDSRGRLVQALAHRFAELGCQEWPALKEEKPTEKTVELLKTLTFPRASATETLALVRDVKNCACDLLEETRKQVLLGYEEQWKYQHGHGTALIGDWQFESIRDTGCIGQLYERLQRHYLFEELCRKTQWNSLIAEKIHRMCLTRPLTTVEENRILKALEQASVQSLEHFGGRYTADQERDVQGVRKQWDYILSLESQDCTSVNQLLELYDRIQATELTDQEKLRLKSIHTLSLVRKKPDPEQICKNAERLCRYAELPEEKQLLRSVAEACPELAVVSKNMTAAQAEARLQILNRLSGAELFTAEVEFEPWGVRQSAGKLLDRIDAFRNYRRGNPEPKMEDLRILNWILDLLQNHTDLELLLAEKYPRLRSRLIPRLAKRENAVSADAMRQLYLAGCTRSALVRGADENTASSWKRATEALFTQWAQLPEPMRREMGKRQKLEKTVMIIQAVLFGLAGVLSVALLALLGEPTVLSLGITAAVLAVAAGGCIVARTLVPDKTCAKQLLYLAAAAVPGLLAAAVLLVLTIIR